MTERRENPVPQGEEDKPPAHSSYPEHRGRARDAADPSSHQSEKGNTQGQRSGKGAHTPAVELDPPGFTTLSQEQYAAAVAALSELLVEERERRRQDPAP